VNSLLDQTHDPALTSGVETANDPANFPIRSGRSTVYGFSQETCSNSRDSRAYAT